MKIIENFPIKVDKCTRVTFIRVEIDDLNNTILNIIQTLNDMSWINNFDKIYTKQSFLARAKPTADKLSKQLRDNLNDPLTEDTGEYVVSEISRKSIINNLNYLDIPLAELLGRKISGNPGFDFFTANDLNTIIFGEAKYSSLQNSYGRALSQVVDFINKEKDIADLKLIDEFCDETSLNKATLGEKGFAIGFAAKQIPTEELVKNIKRNQDFISLLQYEELLIVAVNI